MSAAASQLGTISSQAVQVSSATEVILSGQRSASKAAEDLARGQRAAVTELTSLQQSQTLAFEQAARDLVGLGRGWRASLEGLQRGADEVRVKQLSVERTLDRLIALQRLLLGEVGGVRTALWYAASFLLALALTSTPPTYVARFGLLALLLVCAMLEECVLQLLVRRVGFEPTRPQPCKPEPSPLSTPM